MAELNKKLHLLKLDSTQEAIKLYSTLAEVGDNYITLRVDNSVCYAKLGDIADVNASHLRIKKNGVTYAGLTIAKPAYAEVDFTTAGNFTWTAPVNVTRIRLALVGGGGSATVDFFGTKYSYGYPTASRFGSYATSTSKINHTRNESPKGYALGFDSALGSGAYGKGAPSVGDYNGFTGNTYNGYIDVVAGQSYTIVVGAPDSTYSSKGNNGFVKIAYGGDI